MILPTITLVLFATTAVLAVIYPYLRRKESAAFWRLQMAEGDEAIDAARQSYWRLDRAQTWLALAGIGCYALTLAVVVTGQAIKVVPQNLPAYSPYMISIFGVTMAIWAIAITATIYNSRQSDMRMKADNLRLEKESRRRRQELEASRQS